MIKRKIDSHASVFYYDFDLHPGTVSHPKRLYICGGPQKLDNVLSSESQPERSFS